MVEYPPEDLLNSTFRCSGAIIAPTQVITTADCVAVEAPMLLGVRLRHEIIEGFTVDGVSAVQRVTIHPDYIQSQAVETNVAIARVS